MKFITLTLFTTVLFTLLSQSIYVQAQKVYWTDNVLDEIRRSNLDGTGIETVLSTGGINPSGVAIDAVGGKIYWTDNTPRIARANLDGTGLETLLSSGSVSVPIRIALDIAGGKMYWTDNGFDQVRKANLDGTGMETLLSTGSVFSNPSGIALDITGGKVYWTDFTPRIARANLDGTGQQNLVISGNVISPTGISLDIAGGKMYWTDNGFDQVRKANLDGTGIEAVLSTGSIFSNPTDIAVDALNEKIYWTDLTPRIACANMNGTGVQTLVSSGVGTPTGIALDNFSTPPNCDFEAAIGNIINFLNTGIADTTIEASNKPPNQPTCTGQCISTGSLNGCGQLNGFCNKLIQARGAGNRCDAENFLITLEDWCDGSGNDDKVIGTGVSALHQLIQDLINCPCL